MIGKILKSLIKHREPDKSFIEINRTLSRSGNLDIQKLESNLTTIDYETFLHAIYQEDIFYHDNLANNTIDAPTDNYAESQDLNILDTFRLEEPEEAMQMDFEEEYQFVLVKKANPKPTVVMRTKLLQQLEDSTLAAEFRELKNNTKNK